MAGFPGFEGAGKELKQWVEQKKNEGVGGVGGAVLGGMVAGPLGAFLGAQIGTNVGKLVPTLEKAVKHMERGTDEAQEGREEPQQRRQRQPAEQLPEDRPPPQQPFSRTDEQATQPSSQAVRSRAVKVHAAAYERTDAMVVAITSRCNELEAHIVALYAKAEEALQAGDEAAARHFLASRAEVAKALEKAAQLRTEAEAERATKLRNLSARGGAVVSGPSLPTDVAGLGTSPQVGQSLGPGLPSAGGTFVDQLQMLKQSAVAKRNRLETEAAALYAQAEQALKDGNETQARDFLASWTEVQGKLREMSAGSAEDAAVAGPQPAGNDQPGFAAESQHPLL